MYGAIELCAAIVNAAFAELALFAGVCFVLAGIDELAVDVIWAVRTAWRRLTIYTRNSRCYASKLPLPGENFRLAVFIPAWDESAIIQQMIHNSLVSYADANVTLFIGCYRNDARTLEAVEIMSGSDVILALAPVDGPSTKADCLNAIWAAAIDFEQRNGMRFDAVVLHDAEDVVSRFEARIVAHLLPRFGLIQLPVVPLVDSGSRWVSGHYCDEFAESHGKGLIVREALGAGLPLAGVGCAIRRDLLANLSDAGSGRPFDDGSLTEDYETGLKLSSNGRGAAFVRMLERPGGSLVATRAYFPATFDAAVQQKSRWIIGISIAGWDRLGWGKGFVENWMRLRDRQGLISGAALLAGYIALLLGGLSLAFEMIGFSAPPISKTLALLIWICSALFAWRLLVRAFFVGRIYGVIEAVRSIPRAVIANLIAIRAARRAVSRYSKMLKRGGIEWDKTAHKFPDAVA